MFGAEDFRGRSELANALEVFHVPGIDENQCRLALQRAVFAVMQYEKTAPVSLTPRSDHSGVAQLVVQVLDAYRGWALQNTPQRAHFELGYRLLSQADSLLRRSGATPEAVEETDYQTKLKELLTHLKLMAAPHSYQSRLQSAEQANAPIHDPDIALQAFVSKHWRKVVSDLYCPEGVPSRSPFRELASREAIECRRRLTAVKAELEPFVLAEVTPQQVNLQ